MKRPGALGVALTAATLTGCLLTYDADDVELVPADTTQQVIVNSPRVDQQFDCTLEIRLDVRNINLVPHWGLENVDGQGHLHFEIAGIRVPPDPLIGIDSESVDISIHRLVPTGRQELVVTLHTNQHEPFPSVAEITVDWEKVEPSGGCGGAGGGGGGGNGDG
jgi:hypothetical protein